jgi:hypothetical protein
MAHSVTETSGSVGGRVKKRLMLRDAWEYQETADDLRTWSILSRSDLFTSVTKKSESAQ